MSPYSEDLEAMKGKRSSMTDGYWINYRNYKIFEITEHEQWIRDPKNAKRIGVPENVHGMAKNIKNREKYLLFLMAHAPIIRVRGHGSTVTFEMNARDRQDIMDSIWIWGKKNAGPFTWMNITNFATKENTQMSFEDFEKLMAEGGPEAVLRVASLNTPVRMNVKIARELLALSRQLLALETTVRV